MREGVATVPWRQSRLASSGADDAGMMPSRFCFLFLCRSLSTKWSIFISYYILKKMCVTPSTSDSCGVLRFLLSFVDGGETTRESALSGVSCCG
jgi:hypothetical protein